METTDFDPDYDFDHELEMLQAREEMLTELYPKAEALVRIEGRCSISFIQGKLRVGYNICAELVDRLEKNNVLATLVPKAPVLSERQKHVLSRWK